MTDHKITHTHRHKHRVRHPHAHGRSDWVEHEHEHNHTSVTDAMVSPLRAPEHRRHFHEEDL